MFTNMLFCCIIILYSHTKFQCSISSVHKYAPIVIYGLGLFIVVLTQGLQCDVARLVSKPHKPGKFHGLVLFSL